MLGAISCVAYSKNSNSILKQKRRAGKLCDINGGECGNHDAAQLVAAECIVEAETKDHLNWELPGSLLCYLGESSGDSLLSCQGISFVRVHYNPTGSILRLDRTNPSFLE